ncbi:MAG: cupin domain-containing protein [Pseudohongiellaceae bacterium]
MRLFPERFDRQQFLTHYWQQKPLLIRGEGAFADPLDADELAGLACEEAVESRLIRHDGHNSGWQLDHGPFDPQTLAGLGERNFCLLVQAVDQWHPAARALLQSFDFLPGWRLDDIMASCSGDGGSAGPHFDHYDVFLIQGAGRKRWQIGQVCDADTPVDEDSGLRLMDNFEIHEEHEVQGGDILYIPARYAHHGIAIDTSLTWSVGFRAPSHAEIITGLAAFLADHCDPGQRYTDRQLTPPVHPGEIPESATDQLESILNTLIDSTAITTWFGEHMTRPRYPELLVEDEDDTGMSSHLAQGKPLYKAPGARFAFARHAGELQVFADGQSLHCPNGLAPLVESLCDHRLDRITAAMETGRQDAALSLLESLYNQGSLLKEPPYDDPDLE